MALSTQDSDEDRQYILVAKMDSARTMTTALKAIHFKDVRLTTSELRDGNAWVGVGALVKSKVIMQIDSATPDCLESG